MSVDEIREKYLKEEGKIEGKIEGREEGINLTKKVFKLANRGESIINIAKICEISEDEVKTILD